MTDTPSHLGGHGNTTHIDTGTLKYLKKKYEIKSMVDIGCGPGGMVQVAKDMGINCIGIDGDPNVNPDILWDFTDNMLLPGMHSFDLGYSVEFLEHVDEQYMENYMWVFGGCEYIVCTAAPPGKKGHHHVNCQDTEYWIDAFAYYGFDYDKEETKNIRRVSTMTREFMKKYGMFFTRSI